MAYVPVWYAILTCMVLSGPRLKDHTKQVLLSLVLLLTCWPNRPFSDSDCGSGTWWGVEMLNQAWPSGLPPHELLCCYQVPCVSDFYTGK
jgi:hypothetical protein